MNRKVTGEDIIRILLANMEEGLEPVWYTVLVPSTFNVILHDEDYHRLHGVFPVIVAEATQALEETLERLNRRERLSWTDRVLFKRKPKGIKRADEGFCILIRKDEDEDLKRGELLVHSELAIPAAPQFLGGARTKHTKTFSGSEGTTTKHHFTDTPARAQSQKAELPERVYAAIAFTDDDGPHTYAMKKKQIVVGRGGRQYWADLKLRTKSDVSREHLRLRYCEDDDTFYIKDLSTYGTSVDGRRIPSSIEKAGDSDRDKNVEVPLPRTCRIELADTIVLDFRAEDRT